MFKNTSNPSTFAETRVINGRGAIHGDFPHQVSLQNTSTHNNHFCGASIIHPKFLLTAAHCFGEDLNVANVRAVAGAYNIKRSDGNEKQRQIRHVTRLIPHENFNSKTFDNDIALLELDKAFNFDTKYVRPIILRDSKWPLPRKKG